MCLKVREFLHVRRAYVHVRCPVILDITPPKGGTSEVDQDNPQNPTSAFSFSMLWYWALGMVGMGTEVWLGIFKHGANTKSSDLASRNSCISSMPEKAAKLDEVRAVSDWDRGEHDSGGAWLSGSTLGFPGCHEKRTELSELARLSCPGPSRSGYLMAADSKLCADYHGFLRMLWPPKPHGWLKNNP